MRTLVVFGTQGTPADLAPAHDTVTIDGVSVPCGLVELGMPAFAPHSTHRNHVVVRVHAVSCNYRDKVFITALPTAARGRFCAIGSEFAGEVIAIGADVTTLRPGDRVMPDCRFRSVLHDEYGAPAGVPTNRASRAVHVLHERQLHRVPSGMSEVEAAAFALNAQTAFSMVRRAAPQSGATALVTSGASNVSLYVLDALRARGVSVHATTTSETSAMKLAERGVTSVTVVRRHRAGFETDEAVDALAKRVGGFDCVFDPFFDLHLERVVRMMNPFGTYVTCGLAGQTAGAATAAGVATEVSMQRVFAHAITMNLTLVGNCIGVGEDLDAAAQAFESGALVPVVDSVFAGDDAAPFLDRTYNDARRFGKVVFRYE